MPQQISILGFAGSLRKGSYSKAVLREALNDLPPNTTLEIFDLEGIPLFNQDLEAEVPEKVKAFKSKIEKADAMLIVTPEQNHSVSAVLKNALEWGSRPDGDNSFDGKAAAIITLSTGIRGGVRAEGHLRQMFVDLNLMPINKPRVYVANADQKIGEKGVFSDERTSDSIKALLAKLAELARKLQGN